MFVGWKFATAHHQTGHAVGRCVPAVSVLEATSQSGRFHQCHPLMFCTPRISAICRVTAHCTDQLPPRVLAVQFTQLRIRRSTSDRNALPLQHAEQGVLLLLVNHFEAADKDLGVGASHPVRR
ncbi:protein of unknown function [Streptomyces murinus]